MQKEMMIKIFNPIKSRRPWLPILISLFSKAFLTSGQLYYQTSAVLKKIYSLDHNQSFYFSLFLLLFNWLMKGEEIAKEGTNTLQQLLLITLCRYSSLCKKLNLCIFLVLVDKEGKEEGSRRNSIFNIGIDIKSNCI